MIIAHYHAISCCHNKVSIFGDIDLETYVLDQLEEFSLEH